MFTALNRATAAQVFVTFYVWIILVFRFFVMFPGQFLVMFFPLSLSLTLVTCFLFHSCTSSPITSPQYLVSWFTHSHRKILTSLNLSCQVCSCHSFVRFCLIVLSRFHSLVYLFHAIVLFCFVFS